MNTEIANVDFTLTLSFKIKLNVSHTCVHLILHVIYNILIFSITGRNETTTDVLKSMLAIYLFREKVRKLKEAGCDFSKHLVVPENDSNTSERRSQPPP